ncbi:MAG: hypothetical protein IJB97_02050, partial [Clostridia bacterium]|nr:hypothetical protein [Clostridia bacterium]
MKSKKFIALALGVAGATLLVSCSTSNVLSFNANWYYDTTTKNTTENVETLKYAVTFDPAEGLFSGSYTADYDDGTYTTELKTANVNGETVYEYKTELTIPVAFIHRGSGTTSETFTDSVTSVVRFKTATAGLAPIFSEKTMKSHSPAGTEVSSLEDCYTEYNYTVSVTYEGTAANYTVSDAIGNVVPKKDGEAAGVKTGKFTASQKDYTYLDNEQILFAIRGLSTGSHKFVSYNPLTKAMQTLSLSTGDKKGMETEFVLTGATNPTAKKNVNYYPFTLKLNSKTPGSSQARPLFPWPPPYR